MMRHLPGRSEIAAAERRVAQARADTMYSLQRIPAALRATLSKPRSLALIGGAAGLFGVWLERQDKACKSRPPATAGASAAKTTSIAAIVIAFAIRQALQNLPMIVHHLRREKP